MTNIVVSELGESVVEARVSRWLKTEGDRVEIGDALVSLETEKVDLEVNADQSGVLTSIKRREGEDVKIGELLGVLDEAAAASGNGAGNGAGNSAAGKTDSAAAKAAAPAPPPPAATDTRATPTAKRIAREHDVDLGAVQGSGPAGRVMKQDVTGAMGAKGAIGAMGAIGAKGAPSTTPIAPVAPLARIAPG